MDGLIFLAALAAAAVTMAWCGLSLWLGPLTGFVDSPDDPELKVHARPAVTLGGAGVFAGVHAGMAIAGIFDLGLLAATGMLLVLGLADDRFRLPAPIRLIVEVVAAIVLVTRTTIPQPGTTLGVLAAIVLAVVAVNAVNLFDGLDGLAGTAALVTLLGLGSLAIARGAGSSAHWIAAGALVGFLPLNLHPARVFLGDNGAYVVGGSLAYGVLAAAPGGSISSMVVGSLALGAVLVDLAVTISRRLLSRTALFAGDRSHVYDQLRDRGWSIGAILITTVIAQFLFAALTIGIDTLPAPAAAWIATAVGALALGALWLSGFVRSELRRDGVQRTGR